MSDQRRAPSAASLNWGQLSALIEASTLLNATLDHNEVLRQLMSLVAEGVEADRATLYLLDESQGELRSIVLMDEKLHEICLPVEKGLAGYVARTGQVVNVADAYSDPRFNPQIDQEAGYRTRSIVTVPMCDSQGRVRGVLQALNKEQGLFSEEDELYLLALAEQALLALESARQHEEMAADCQRLAFLYRICSLSTTDMSLAKLLLTAVQGLTEALTAATSSILLPKQRQQRLVFVTASDKKVRALMEIEVPLKGSIAGWVLQHGEAIIVNDVQNDPRFFPEADERTGFTTHSLIGAPMKVRGQVIGVLEALNKRNRIPFSESDLKLAQAVANHLALVIETAGEGQDLRKVWE